jgi:intracellular sulfur oxidation DsrE/DsrF family protein
MTAYKTIVQLNHHDETLYKSSLRQLSNLKTALPEVLVEVAVHGSAYSLLLASSSFKNTLEHLHQQGIEWLLCQNTLNAHQLTSDNLLPFVKIIPSAVAHIVVRQSEGWSYLKMG